MFANAPRFAKSVHIFFRERFPIYGSTSKQASWKIRNPFTHMVSLLLTLNLGCALVSCNNKNTSLILGYN